MNGVDETLEIRLKAIADIAHSGGLAGLSVSEALAAISRLSAKNWDKSRGTDKMKADAINAVKLSERGKS